MKTSSYFNSKVKKQLEKFFDQTTLNRLAKTCGFTLRKAKKITPFYFVAGFLLQCSKGVNTFNEWARQISLLSGKALSKQALWERIHEGTEVFVQSLLKQLLIKKASNAVQSSLFKVFKRVVIHDSTTFQLPDRLKVLFPGSVVRGMQRAIARIQCVLELKRMRFIDLSLGAYTQNDQGSSSSIVNVVQKGDLLIRDLGYFVLRVLQQLTEKHVYVLSRLRYGVNLYDRRGREMHWKTLLKKERQVDQWVYIGEEHPVWVRLVMIPLSKKQSAERVRRAKTDRDKRCHHSSLYYEWLHYNVFITTVGKDIWSTSEVAKAYGVRWQIEIVFKSWKSGFRMRNLLCEHCDEEYRVKTSIYLLLFFMCLFMQKVYMHYRDKVEKQSGKIISLLKLSALFSANMLELLFLSPKRLTQHLALYCCYEKRKDRTNMVEFIKSFKN